MLPFDNLSRNKMRDIAQVSNELELSIHNVRAAEVIMQNGLSLVHEVNLRDVVELYMGAVLCCQTFLTSSQQDTEQPHCQTHLREECLTSPASKLS